MKFKRGFTIIELIMVVGLIAIIALVSGLSLLRRKGTTELDGSARQIVALLREAQSRSVAQSQSKAWGVYFSNSTTSSFFALYSGSTYNTSSQVSYYRLSSNVQFATSTLARGATTTITFAQITGFANASTSIKVHLMTDASVSSTIRIASSGAVTF